MFWTPLISQDLRNHFCKSLSGHPPIPPYTGGITPSPRGGRVGVG